MAAVPFASENCGAKQKYVLQGEMAPVVLLVQLFFGLFLVLGSLFSVGFEDKKTGDSDLFPDVLRTGHKLSSIKLVGQCVLQGL